MLEEKGQSPPAPHGMMPTVERSHILRPSYSAPRYIHKKKKRAHVSNKKQVKRAYHVLHTSKNLETTQMPTDRRVDQLTLGDPHSITQAVEEISHGKR